MSESWERGEYLITTDPSRLDVVLIHNFLSNESYWAVWLCPRRYRLFDVRMARRCVCSFRTSWARFGEMVNGSDTGASRLAGVSPLGAGDKRCAKFVCAIRFHSASPA